MDARDFAGSILKKARDPSSSESGMSIPKIGESFKTPKPPKEQSSLFPGMDEPTSPRPAVQQKPKLYPDTRKRNKAVSYFIKQARGFKTPKSFVKKTFTRDLFGTTTGVEDHWNLFKLPTPDLERQIGHYLNRKAQSEHLNDPASAKNFDDLAAKAAAIHHMRLKGILPDTSNHEIGLKGLHKYAKGLKKSLFALYSDLRGVTRTTEDLYGV